MSCNSCGRPNADGSAYCVECSAPLVAVCSKGHLVRPGRDANYCPECRAPIKVRPASRIPAVGCLARVIAWLTVLVLTASAVRAIHHATWSTVLAVFAIFGITQTDIDNAIGILVLLPALIGLASYMIPDPVGKGIRSVLGWVMSRLPALLWRAAVATCKSVAVVVDGPPKGTDRKGKRRGGETDD